MIPASRVIADALELRGTTRSVRRRSAAAVPPRRASPQATATV